jgi:hypothetical protein
MAPQPELLAGKDQAAQEGCSTPLNGNGMITATIVHDETAYREEERLKGGLQIIRGGGINPHALLQLLELRFGKRYRVSVSPPPLPSFLSSVYES